MNLHDFGEKIKNHDALFLADTYEKDGKDWITIGNKETEGGWTITEPSVTWAGNDWEYLEAIFLGKRAPAEMIQLTRIVGYFSRTANWNMSKIEELKARHKGKYSVPEDK